MRQSQSSKTTAWNAELLRLVVGSVASAHSQKLESALQIAMENPQPRTFVEATSRFEQFTEPRVVMDHPFFASQLLEDMRALLLTTVTANFDRGRNFNVTHALSADGLGVTTKLTWNQN